MSAVTLVLGPIAFLDFEIPSGINFGGRQLLTVHQMTDGRRIVDCIGGDELEISFCGTFSGVDAAQRARVLNSLRVTGSPLILSWDIFYYTVVLSHFDANYENSAWIPYRISCTVVQDMATTVPPAMISLGNSVLTDLGVAANQCTDLGVDFTNIQNDLASPKSTSLGSAAYVSAQSSISLTQAVISAKLMANEAIIQSFTTSSFSSAESLKINLAAAAIATQNLANLTTASGYVGRAARSLSNAST